MRCALVPESALVPGTRVGPTCRGRVPGMSLVSTTADIQKVPHAHIFPRGSDVFAVCAAPKSGTAPRQSPVTEPRDGVPHLALLRFSALTPAPIRIRTDGSFVCTEPNGAGTGAVFLRTTPDRTCTGTDRGCTSLLLRCTGEDPVRTDSGPVRTGADLIRTVSEPVRTGVDPVRTRLGSVRTGTGWICTTRRGGDGPLPVGIWGRGANAHRTGWPTPPPRPGQARLATLPPRLGRAPPPDARPTSALFRCPRSPPPRPLRRRPHSR